MIDYIGRYILKFRTKVLDMIILITGASHTGKTLLAQKLLEKTSCPYLSIDHLKMGLIRSGNTDLTPEDDEELTEYLWPVIREIMKTAIPFTGGRTLMSDICLRSVLSALP